MRAGQANNRAFDHALRHYRDGQKQGLARKFFYKRLMRVSIQHTYYNASNDACPDFVTSPTTVSQILMRNLGLLFKDEGTGFTILYNESRESDLFDYLRRQGEPDSPGRPFKGTWTRLSFLLSLNNPYFINFTNIPVNTNPAKQNFYFTNQQAHKKDGEIILNLGRRVNRADLMNVVRAQVEVAARRRVKEVEVRDISDEQVICKPRCIPRGLLKLKNPDAITCEDVEKFLKDHPNVKPCKDETDEHCVCRDTIYLNFSLLPDDKYTIEKVLEDRPDKKHPVLYTVSYPTPLCLIDLLLTDPTDAPPPTKKKRDFYPIRRLFSKKPKIKAYDYRLKFETRSTIWNYFIVPQTGRFVSLKINSVSGPEVNFAGPFRLLLANDALAYWFFSETTIPLQQASIYDFQLSGVHISGTHNQVAYEQETILVNRLPLASIKQVLPESKMLPLIKNLCSDAQDEARHSDLVEQASESSSVGEFLERIKRLRADTKPETGQQPISERPPEYIFSDIYVYV